MGKVTKSWKKNSKVCFQIFKSGLLKKKIRGCDLISPLFVATWDSDQAAGCWDTLWVMLEPASHMEDTYRSKPISFLNQLLTEFSILWNGMLRPNYGVLFLKEMTNCEQIWEVRGRWATLFPSGGPQMNLPNCLIITPLTSWACGVTASCFAHRNISSCTPATLLLPLCGNSIYSHLFLLRKLCFYFFLRSAEVSGPDKQDRCSQRDYRVEFKNSRSSARFLSRCKKTKHT